MSETPEKKYHRILMNKFFSRLTTAKVTDEPKIKAYVSRIERLSSMEIKHQEIKSILNELGFDPDEMEDLKHDVEEAMVNEPQHREQELDDLKTKTLQQMFKDGIPDIEWRVENIVPMRGVVIMGGDSGSYKTWTGMHLGMSVASGTEFLGKFPTTKGTVLYIEQRNGNHG